MQAFLKLVRFPNLLIIALTQYFIRYAVLLPFFSETKLAAGFSHLDFFLLVLSTVFIAAAGYVINDYFDTRTDRINRPESVVIDRSIKRRVAMALHVLFNFIGIALGFYLGYKAGVYKLGLIHVFSAGLLWFYSTDFKKQFLIGNVVVSLLTATVPLVVPVFELPFAKTELNTLGLEQEELSRKHLELVQGTGQIITEQQAQEMQSLHEQSQHYLQYIEGANEAINYAFKLIAVFALFAFLTSLIREIIKDMEDYDGDLATGGKTMPIVLGIPATKYITIALTVVTVALLGWVQLNRFENGDMLSVLYLLGAVQLPLVLLMVRLSRSSEPEHFHKASMLVKLIMLTGISYAWIIYYTITASV